MNRLMFTVSDFAGYWRMDQHVSMPETGGWVVRSEWNRMRRGRTHESQSWAALQPEPPKKRGFWYRMWNSSEEEESQ